ncbi:hypothetical protein OC716_00155, partial [Candidatus Phytoplasma aurantifolia]|nr:hypothetical protein [Candidatus Phytoplasma aurantifolia]
METCPSGLDGGCFVIHIRKYISDKQTQIIYPYHEQSEHSVNNNDGDISSNSILSGSGSLQEQSVNSPTVWDTAKNALNFVNNNADEFKEFSE